MNQEIQFSDHEDPLQAKVVGQITFLGLELDEETEKALKEFLSYFALILRAVGQGKKKFRISTDFWRWLNDGLQTAIRILEKTLKED